MPSYLGQNFLKDSTYTILIAQKVAQICADLKLEQCIEIGPGKGALTKKLIAIVDKPLVLLEKDETLLPHLQQFLDNSENKKIDLLMGDALALNTASLLEKKGRNPIQTIVVGNLPYYITSPLITKFFGGGHAVFPAGVFMVQKEVADKIRSDAEKKSFLWRLLNYQYEVKYLKTVPAKAFNPAPKVQSAVFSLIAKSQTPAFAYDEMVWVLDQISKYKRKTLGKCWKMAGKNNEELKIKNSEGQNPVISSEVEKSLYISHGLKRFYLPKDLENKRLEEIGLEEMGRIIKT